MNVHEKLLQVQSKLSAPKSQYNSFGKYHYRNCEDIQEAAKPLLQETNAILVVGDELIQIADRFYIKATASFIDCESGSLVSNTAFAREELEKKGMDVSQVTGSASSYARKYALNGLFCIDDVKDADNQDNSASGKKQTGGSKAVREPKKDDRPAAKKEEAPPGGEADAILNQKIDKAKQNVISGELQRTGVKEETILSLFNLKQLEDMTVGQFKKVMKKFEATQSKEE